MDRGKEQNPYWTNSSFTPLPPPNPPSANTYTCHYHQMYPPPSNTSSHFEAPNPPQQQQRTLELEPVNHSQYQPLPQITEDPLNDLLSNPSLSEFLNTVLDVVKRSNDIKVEILNQDLIRKSRQYEEENQKTVRALAASSEKVELCNFRISELGRDKKKMEKELENLKAENESLTSALNEKTSGLQDLRGEQTDDCNYVSKFKELGKRNRELEEENEMLRLDLETERENRGPSKANWEQARKKISYHLVEIMKVTNPCNSQTAREDKLQMNGEIAKKRFNIEKNENQKVEAKRTALETNAAAGVSDEGKLDGTVSLAGSIPFWRPSTSRGFAGDGNPAGSKRTLLQQSIMRFMRNRGRPTGRREPETFKDNEVFRTSDDTDDE